MSTFQHYIIDMTENQHNSEIVIYVTSPGNGLKYKSRYFFLWFYTSLYILDINC